MSHFIISIQIFCALDSLLVSCTLPFLFKYRTFVFPILARSGTRTKGYKYANTAKCQQTSRGYNNQVNSSPRYIGCVRAQLAIAILDFVHRKNISTFLLHHNARNAEQYRRYRYFKQRHHNARVE